MGRRISASRSIFKRSIDIQAQFSREASTPKLNLLDRISILFGEIDYICGLMGKVIIFSAPSGSGKSTVVGHLLGLHPEFEFSVSAASRAPRGAERDGVEYHFISVERFRELIAEDGFVEYEEVYPGSYYGTLKSEVERIWAKGNVIVFDVDVKGAANLKKYFGADALSVLILPPSMEVLRKRLTGRGTDSPEAIEMRLAKAREEIDFASDKCDVRIVNDRLEETFATAERIVDTFLAG